MRALFFLIALTFASCTLAKSIVELHNDKLAIKISSIGAELQSIKRQGHTQEYLWHGDPKYWKGRAPFMFPVNVRFKNETFNYLDQSYNMPLLGLAHTATFDVKKISQSKASFTFRSNEETLRQYPFQFQLTITYELIQHEIKHHFLLKNLGDNTLYYALGGHPGFTFPTTAGKTRKDYTITFSKKMTTNRLLLANGLIQGEEIPFLNNENRLDMNDPRVPKHGILLLNHKAKRIGLAEKGERPFIEVEFGDFPNVNIWSPPDKPFVCIEPQVGHHDLQNSPTDIKKKKYLMRLKPQKKKQYRFSIFIHP